MLTKRKQQRPRRLRKNAEPADGTPDPKDQTISKQQEEIDELSNRLLRLQADFDNFRKRNTEERERLGRFVTASVVREFLKVLDNFERAEASVEKTMMPSPS